MTVGDAGLVQQSPVEADDVFDVSFRMPVDCSLGETFWLVALAPLYPGKRNGVGDGQEGDTS